MTAIGLAVRVFDVAVLSVAAGVAIGSVLHWWQHR